MICTHSREEAAIDVNRRGGLQRRLREDPNQAFNTNGTTRVDLKRLS